jgi:DNA-binding transcriptional ArsR family regulator
VNELAEPFEMSLPAISKHLKVLEHAGLITRGREAQYRPAKLEPQALMGIDEWLERYRKLWNERFDRLEIYLKELQSKEKKNARKRK